MYQRVVNIGSKPVNIFKQESAKVVPQSMIDQPPREPQFLERSDLFIDPNQEATASQAHWVYGDDRERQVIVQKKKD